MLKAGPLKSIHVLSLSGNAGQNHLPFTNQCKKFHETGQICCP